MAKILGLQKGIIYGPVDSRRLGRSLGINLSPTDYKACSFNCVYCHYGWTKHLETDLSRYAADLPTVDAVEEALEKALREVSPPPAYITFSGNGEPTLHPEFAEIVDRVIAVKQRSGSDAKLAILSNSTAVGDARVRDALAKLDVRIMKLDAGTEEGFDRINRPAPGVSLDGVVKGLKLLGDITLQSVFVDGEVTNAREEDVEAWLKAVREIAPAAMQVYSLENAPAMSTLVGVPLERLREIRERVREVLDTDVEAY
jgi:wyosine [tRNA(Phe)-imidazoG37] synthetase (radical SAM superfamily)